MRIIEFYRTENDRCPVEEFLDSLSDKHAQKVVWVLRLVEQLERVPEQYLKKLTVTEHIWEIRAQIGGTNYRFLGFFDGPVLMILTNGFSKKQQKAPAREVELAEARRLNHLQRRRES